jgi:nicotinamidase-related amidase
LDHLNAKTLILTGLTADICVLFTANDAHLRGYRLFVPSDCVASIDDAHHRHALDYIARVEHADIRPSTELKFDRSKVY